MKNLLTAIVAFIGLAFTASPASAAAIVDFDGSFGSFSSVVNGTFNHTWDFTVSLPGKASAGLTAVKVTMQAGITFNDVLFNGTPLTQTMFGDVQQFSLANVLVPSGLQVLSISGSGYGSYGGSVAFAAIPEPATWAMLILGFGAAGMVLRRRNTRTWSHATC